MKRKIKCLITEAQEKCKCEDCKSFRKIREINMNMYIAFKVHGFILDALQETDKR